MSSNKCRIRSGLPPRKKCLIDAMPERIIWRRVRRRRCFLGCRKQVQIAAISNKVYSEAIMRSRRMRRMVHGERRNFPRLELVRYWRCAARMASWISPAQAGARTKKESIFQISSKSAMGLQNWMSRKKPIRNWCKLKFSFLKNGINVLLRHSVKTAYILPQITIKVNLPRM